jgi:hypothetical protein
MVEGCGETRACGERRDNVSVGAAGARMTLTCLLRRCRSCVVVEDEGWFLALTETRI